MRVRSGGEQREKRFDDRVIPREAVAARLAECGRAGVERRLERGGVLPRNTVPIGGKPHHFEQRHRRFVRDILRVRPSEPTWRRKSNGRVHVVGVVHGGRLEHAPQRATKADPPDSGRWAGDLRIADRGLRIGIRSRR